MITSDELKKIYADKLIKTGSQDAAFTKAVWCAYKKGTDDAMDRETCRTCDKIKQGRSKETYTGGD